MLGVAVIVSFVLLSLLVLALLGLSSEGFILRRLGHIIVVFVVVVIAAQSSEGAVIVEFCIERGRQARHIFIMIMIINVFPICIIWILAEPTRP